MLFYKVILIFYFIFIIGANNNKNAPNIFFIICDSLDGRLLLDSNRPFPAPTFDYLVSNGVTFSNTYSNSPVCTPARAALWSGRHINEVQAWSNDKGLPANYTPKFNDTLSDNGYFTFIRGKEDFSTGDHSESGNVMDWTRSIPFINISMTPQPNTVLVPGGEKYVEGPDWNNTNKMAKWIKEEAKQNEPYLAYLGLDIPHPWSTRALNFDHVDVGGDATFGTSDFYLPSINISKISVPKWLPWEKMHPVDVYSSITKNMTGNWTTEEIITIRQYYYAMCMELDSMLGVLVDALKSSGTFDNTYIFFTSDHGEMAMEHRQYFKMTYYEASSHVPLVVTGPGVKPSIVTNVTSLIDLYPTLVDIAGAPLPPLLNGTSLMPFLNPSAPTSAPPERPDYILSQYHGALCNTSWFMLRTANYKYVAFDDGISTPPQLFDLESDPDELQNLSDQLPNVVASLDTKLRGIIDYPEVVKEVESYNKVTFRQWQEEQGSEYEEVIENLTWFWDWAKNSATNLKLIEIWLNS